MKRENFANFLDSTLGLAATQTKEQTSEDSPITTPKYTVSEIQNALRLIADICRSHDEDKDVCTHCIFGIGDDCGITEDCPADWDLDAPILKFF